MSDTASASRWLLGCDIGEHTQTKGRLIMLSSVFCTIRIAVIGALFCVALSTASAVTSACAYNQSSGTGGTFWATCETVNGNVVKFTSPSNVESIRVGAVVEGYGICDTTSLRT